MNFLRLLARRLSHAFAVLRDPDAGMLQSLPPPVVDPRVNADRLSRAAREQGRADGERYIFDGWSFGGPDEPPDAILDPEYVQALRRQCQSAVHEHRHRQRLTDARLVDLHLVTRDAEHGMRAARDRMARVAVRHQLGEEDSLREFLGRRNLNADAIGGLPPLEDPVWEGEAPPMHPIWRALLVGFLVAVVFVIEQLVAEAYLSVAGLTPPTLLVMTAAFAGLTILGPMVAGQLFRSRHATGFDRVLPWLTFVLLVPTLAAVLGFGLLAARLLNHNAAAGPAGAAGLPPAAALGLTPGTMVVVFTVALILACAMAYLLGLARPHPFQQAFARNRRLRNRIIRLTQRMGERVNPDYRATAATVDTDDGPPGGELEQAITQAYLAAENAYYQGLIEAVADPTFTEAVLRRRNRPGMSPPIPGVDAAAFPDGAP